MKVAIVTDWLITYSGAERVLAEIINCFPKADLFSVVDFVPEKSRGFLCGKKPQTTFIQKLPFAEKFARHYISLMPLAIEQLDLSGYELIISSSHAVSKGVIVGPDQLHISYVHSPMRYIWDLQSQYLRESGLEKKFLGWLVRFAFHKLRIWDARTAFGVDCFIANSRYISRRIKRVYGRESSVIYPPVDIECFSVGGEKEDFYVTSSRLVPYKRVDLIVGAFSLMPDKRLFVIGDGPDIEKIKAIATPNVTIMGYQPTEVLKDFLQRAKAFVFAAEEDFGIAPVEAQACGTPVIAYAKGGALETVIGTTHSNGTGVFFFEQSVDGIVEAVKLFETCHFDTNAIRANAERFSVSRFRDRFTSYVESQVARWESAR